jgi:hypothetical protein
MGIDFSLTGDPTKRNLRDKIRALPEGESIWQCIQAKAYGAELDKAELSKGFREFVLLARLRGCRLIIISHKTEIAPSDPGRVLLRVAANRWLDDHGFFNRLGFRFDQLYYCATRGEKISKIQSLGCDVFIDDLTEILEAPGFPQSTRKILFNPGTQHSRTVLESCGSWKQIIKTLFGLPQSGEVLAVARQIWPEISFPIIESIEGRGNSIVFRLPDTTEGDLLLKIYPDQEMDSRPRMRVEFSALETLHRKGLPVPRPVRKSDDLEWALYQWLPGNNPKIICNGFREAAKQFLEKVNAIPRTSFSFLQPASEACMSGFDLEQQIAGRLQRLKELRDDSLDEFLSITFLPLMKESLKKAKASWPRAWDAKIDPGSCVLSPSDFGTHNCHVSTHGEFSFFDFEYFGLDDPVKLICDFFWHPGMPSLFDSNRLDVVKTIAQLYRERYSIDESLGLALPLFGLRWILILLNEFHPHLMEKRMQAQGPSANPEKIKEGKLALAGRYAIQASQALRGDASI